MVGDLVVDSFPHGPPSSAAAAAAAAKSLQSCPTLCDPKDGGPLSLGFSSGPAENQGFYYHGRENRY